MDDRPHTFKLDTGASVTVVWDIFASRYKLKKPQKTLRGPGDTELKVLGTFEANLRHRDEQVTETIYVIKDQPCSLLSRSTCIKLGLVARVHSVSSFTDEFPQLFQGLGKLNTCYSATLKPDARPVCIYAPRKIAHPLLPKVKAELAKMITEGVISPVTELTTWCSGMVVVPKANGSVRICVELTQLNKAVQREIHPMASVDESLAKLGQTDQQTHDQCVRAVLRRLQEAGLTLNDKCQFSKQSVKFLGHIIDGNGIQVDPDKVKAIKDFPPPTNITELQRFMGMMNQLAIFSPNLAAATEPLRILLRKDTAWTWSEPQMTAFQQVKELLASRPVLAHYSPDRETLIAADASNMGIGAVLYQKQEDGTRRPICYISRSLSDAEKNYAVIEKEALAVT
ncbi:hypothetical protein ACOMHN_016573 [Nucella lapillus]